MNGIDPAVRVYDSMPMTESITAALFGFKTAAVLLVVLGIAAVLLAAIGL